MIYIEDKTFDRQVDVLEFFLSHGEFDLIIWFFPESKLMTICKLKLAAEDLIEGNQITTYHDGFTQKKTSRVKLTAEVLKEIRESAKEIRSNCDSMVLYRPGEMEFSVCTIGHEGMCLVKDDFFFNALSSEGFNASKKQPEWW